MGVSSRAKGDAFVFVLTALRNRENQEPETLVSKNKGKRRIRERKQH